MWFSFLYTLSVYKLSLLHSTVLHNQYYILLYNTTLSLPNCAILHYHCYTITPLLSSSYYTLLYYSISTTFCCTALSLLHSIVLQYQYYSLLYYHCQTRLCNTISTTLSLQQSTTRSLPQVPEPLYTTFKKHSFHSPNLSIQ